MWRVAYAPVNQLSLVIDGLQLATTTRINKLLLHLLIIKKNKRKKKFKKENPRKICFPLSGCYQPEICIIYTRRSTLADKLDISPPPGGVAGNHVPISVSQ